MHNDKQSAYTADAQNILLLEHMISDVDANGIWPFNQWSSGQTSATSWSSCSEVIDVTKAFAIHLLRSGTLHTW